MPQERFDADALGVVTGFVRLGYFSGPWIIRITFILFAIWWCVAEILRLNLLRSEGDRVRDFEPEMELQNCWIYFSVLLSYVCSSADVLSKPEHVWFETLSFLSFLSLLCCSGFGVCILVYLPIADSLALRNVQDMEASADQQQDTVSLITNQSPLEEISLGRNSGTSAKRGSISFRTMDKDHQTSGTFVELSLFSPSQHSSPPDSPQLLGWPMLPAAQLQ
ncbi:putative Transmembrane protein [Heracleum sosnowskyi]|uniref:Transmembrane protein n=1 Tax=Heracleum sosnowskyi TaxID=360622 RepID=A0AAD8MQH8_9APIA|nr:putative Transmembrane protein [Heracleum sosnowskyi]